MNIVNGDLPASLLVEVEPGLSLEPATAAAYKRMKDAAAQDGVTLAIPRPAGAYRSLFVQKDMRERGWLYNLDPTSSVALAAPGYSTHGLGDRVDVVRGAAGDWAIRNAHRFGFVREFGAADPRHFRFTKPTWAASAVIPIESEEDDMFSDKDRAHLQELVNRRTMLDLIATPDGTVWWCVNRAIRYAIPGSAQLAVYQAHMRGRGLSDEISRKTLDEARAYGAPVFENQIDRIAAAVDAVISDEAILAAATAGSAGEADLAPVIEALKRLPDEFIAKLKAKL